MKYGWEIGGKGNQQRRKESHYALCDPQRNTIVKRMMWEENCGDGGPMTNPMPVASLSRMPHSGNHYLG